MLPLYGTPVLAQKVAEGEYKIRAASGGGAEAVATHWVLSRKGSGYHLVSQIRSVPETIKVLQIEELDRDLVPTAIGYEGYLKSEPKPGTAFTCRFDRSSILCFGRAECKFVRQSVTCTDPEVPPDAFLLSAPYEFKGPFCLWIDNLFALDMAWLLGGAVNMSHLTSGKGTLTTLTVYGGPGWILGDAVESARIEEAEIPKGIFFGANPAADWDFSSEEVGSLEYVGHENLEINDKAVAIRHYIYKVNEEPIDVWLSDSGMLVKLRAGDGELILSNYKQYKSLIPELRVDQRHNRPR